jgi:hypothetical protein
LLRDRSTERDVKNKTNVKGEPLTGLRSFFYVMKNRLDQCPGILHFMSAEK